MGKMKKVDLEASMIDTLKERLSSMEENFKGAMGQLMEVSMKLQTAQLTVARQKLSLQMQNRGINRLHRNIDRLKRENEAEYAQIRRVVSQLTRALTAAEQGKLPDGKIPIGDFRTDSREAAEKFLRAMAGVR